MRIDPIAAYARSQPDALACADLESDRRWSYAAFDRAVDKAAAWLCERLGPASGARVATLAANSADMLILKFATIRAGAVFVPFNWRLTPHELGALIRDAGAVLLFHDDAFATTAGTIASGLECAVHSFGSGDGAAFAALIASAPDAPPRTARRPLDAATTILYTSGTSGRPKGVILTELNAFFSCSNFIHGNDVTRHSVFLCEMPMFHTVGLLASSRTPLIAGGTVLVSRRFDAPRTLARIADPALGVTHYFSVPQMAQSLWQEPGFDPAILRRLTVYATGGAPNPAAQIERFTRAGIRMSDGFGMSETGSNFGMPVADPDLVIAKAGSCGLPYLAIDARIVDDDGHDLPDGETGELWVSGPSISPGYWNRPEETAKAFVDGWFRTGDAAYRDPDGYYFLIDRRKDMFISGGENVYPAEVEAALAEMEEIAQAAVVGVPDARWGEVGRAYVMIRPGAALAADTIAAHCRQRLATFKVPKSIVITDAIPRNAAGKVLKHVLKARALAEIDAG